jgi:tetratricopeptide (TPR) repeat protein
MRPYAALPVALIVAGSPTPSLWAQAPAMQTSADSYTRYELQAPGSGGSGGSGAFRIIYDVTATTAGAAYYYNSVRAGAAEEVHGVLDLHTGQPLRWRVVGGGEARTGGLPGAPLDGRYIEVQLARPVPTGGGVRIRIDKTYVDTLSYRHEPGGIVFSRSLGIDRNSVVLPAGYELVAVNVPSQVNVEGDGRIRVSFMNVDRQALTYTVRARPLPAPAAQALAASATAQRPRVTPPTPAANSAFDGSWLRSDRSFGERAFESRTITYFLEQPESHAFRLYHDYTENRPGVDRYLNVVRAGSVVRDPWAFSLDTGAELPLAVLTGEAAVARGALTTAQAAAGAEVVLISFPAVAQGASTRLRIHETYVDPNRYARVGDELVWDRNFGRAMNRVVLPHGWYLTHCDMPAAVDTEDDGRVALTFRNPRPDGLQVFLRARERREPVATSLLGERLHARPVPDPAALRQVQAALAAAPAGVDAIIAAARELRNAMAYDEEVALYTRALALAPDDWRLYRFRGHRWISLRRFEDAIRDLDRARALAPYDFDVAYHRGLALYLLGRFDEAADEYLRCIRIAADTAVLAGAPALAGQRPCAEVATRDDSRVAIMEWAYRALRRAGRHEEARALVQQVGPGLDVTENTAYYQAMLARRGHYPKADLLEPLPVAGRFETRAYGVAVDELVDGNRERALFLLRRIAEDAWWPGFGRIAAEADLLRLR